MSVHPWILYVEVLTRKVIVSKGRAFGTAPLWKVSERVPSPCGARLQRRQEDGYLGNTESPNTGPAVPPSRTAPPPELGAEERMSVVYKPPRLECFNSSDGPRHSPERRLAHCCRTAKDAEVQGCSAPHFRSHS